MQAGKETCNLEEGPTSFRYLLFSEKMEQNKLSFRLDNEKQMQGRAFLYYPIKAEEFDLYENNCLFKISATMLGYGKMHTKLLHDKEVQHISHQAGTSPHFSVLKIYA